MRVICRYNNPDKTPSNISRSFNYGLVENQNYIVMGLMKNSDGLWFLLDENGKPNYYPDNIFEIEDGSLSANWYFTSFENRETHFGAAQFIVGYYELCFDKTHYQKLVERDENELICYFSRKEKEKLILSDGEWSV